eukprot:EG_transcript_916
MPTYVRHAVDPAMTIPGAYLVGEGNPMAAYIPQTFQTAFMTLDVPPGSMLGLERPAISPPRTAVQPALPPSGTTKRGSSANPPARRTTSPPAVAKRPAAPQASPGSSLRPTAQTSPPPPRRTPSNGASQRSPSGARLPPSPPVAPAPAPAPAPEPSSSPATPPAPRPPRPSTHTIETQTPPPPTSTVPAAYISPQHRLPAEMMQLDFESDFEVEGLQTDDEWSVDEKINSEMQDPDTDQPRELVTPVDSQDSRGEYASNESELPLLPGPHGERRAGNRPSKAAAAGKARPRVQETGRAASSAKGGSKGRPSSAKAKATSRIQEGPRPPQPRTAAKRSTAHLKADVEPQPKSLQAPLTTWADAATNTGPPNQVGNPGVRLPYRIPTPLVTDPTGSPVQPTVSAPPALGHSYSADDTDLGPPAVPAALLARIQPDASLDDTEVAKSSTPSPGRGLVPRRASNSDFFDYIPPEAFPKLRELSLLLKALQKNSAKPPCRRTRPGYKRPSYQALHKARFQSLCPSDHSAPEEQPESTLLTNATPHAATAENATPPPLYSRLPLSPFGGKVLEQAGSRRFCCSAASMNGQRPSMEDAHGWWLGDTIGVFGVFDGHAGRVCSQFISREFPPQIAACGPALDLETLEYVCLDLDERFIANVNDDSGCTAAFCVAIPLPSGNFKLHVGNIGDARVLVGRQGSVLHATDDHKPTLPGEAKRVQQCGGWVDYGSGRIDGLLAVSRAFGDRRFKAGGPIPTQQKVIAQPALSTVVCEPDDFVVVACDGIFERDFTNDQVVRFVSEALAQSGDAGVACAALCEEALRRGSGDNMTAMVVQFREGAGLRITPLPPPFVVGDHLAMVFETFTKEAALTFGQALQARRDLLLEELSEPQVRAYPPELVQGMHAELSFFGPAPGPLAPPAHRAEWFDRLAAFYQELRRNPHNPQVPDPREETPGILGEIPDQMPPTPFSRRPSRVGEQRSDLPARGRVILHSDLLVRESPANIVVPPSPL